MAKEDTLFLIVRHCCCYCKTSMRSWIWICKMYRFCPFPTVLRKRGHDDAVKTMKLRKAWRKTHPFSINRQGNYYWDISMRDTAEIWANLEKKKILWKDREDEEWNFNHFISVIITFLGQKERGKRWNLLQAEWFTLLFFLGSSLLISLNYARLSLTTLSVTPTERQQRWCIKKIWESKKRDESQERRMVFPVE
jgi:hypothetical protein